MSPQAVPPSFGGGLLASAYGSRRILATRLRWTRDDGWPKDKPGRRSWSRSRRCTASR